MPSRFLPPEWAHFRASDGDHDLSLSSPSHSLKKRVKRKKETKVSQLLQPCWVSFCAGVTSFEVDLESKKVVVVGDVTPYEVLESVSKVKLARLWVAPDPKQQAAERLQA